VSQVPRQAQPCIAKQKHSVLSGRTCRVILYEVNHTTSPRVQWVLVCCCADSNQLQAFSATCKPTRIHPGKQEYGKQEYGQVIKNPNRNYDYVNCSKFFTWCALPVPWFLPLLKHKVLAHPVQHRTD
jgi:hypothetical protein